MRDPIASISLLQKRLNDLQLENQILKNILDRSGISYMQELKRLKTPEESEAYAFDQGARIIHPREITDRMANLFYSRFWGRQDVYAKRSENRVTGTVGYYPQCKNFWQDVCPKKYGQRINCRDCIHRVHKQLTKEDILHHLRGYSDNASDVIGIYPLLKDGTCRFLVYDFDNHEQGAEKTDFANKDDSWNEEVEAMRTICTLNGIDSLVERSRSGKGAHIWIFFDKPISAKTVRKFGIALLNKGAEQVNLKSFKYYDRMLPAQDQLPDGGLGNLIALPLQGKALRQGNSAFIDRNRNAYPNQWEVLWSKPKLSQEFIETKICEWTELSEIKSISGKDVQTREKPWEKNRSFSAEEIDGKLSITLSDAIYVDSLNLKPSMQNKIRRMAAFSNPIFYKNQAIGTSNFNTSRWIYLGQDCPGDYIRIPRGLYDELISNAQQAGIIYEVADERQAGRTIHVTFNGILHDEQKPALTEMMKYDTGILHAATAFGKTVVCSAMIAAKKVNTLILLESSTLLEQWRNSLEKFLNIDESLPEYETKTGRIKTRKSLIGTLQSAHDSMTGIIDIAMAGSLCKHGEYHKFLNQYGMIIVDECHHAAAERIADVLKEAKAKYVYGVTATPKRGDGLEKIIYMLIGPIRYSYSTKEKAKTQGIDHLVYPRFTRVVPPRGVMTYKMHPNEAYDAIHHNEVRDEQILADVKDCVKVGRTPVILSRYKDHSENLFNRMQTYADHVFLLTGNYSKAEHKQILEQMHNVKASETMILVATGKLVGEGFDFPRLDTLFMATPVSFHGVVEQYAGRLNRDYEGKKNVIIYDYVDSHIPMFDNMYAKRLKAYKQIGYDVCSGLENEKQAANAIFDSDNYFSTYREDLLKANKNIVISSPVISWAKVNEFIKLLAKPQSRGVSVTIVTWDPDCYSFGDSTVWMQMHDEMRQAGFFLKTVEDFCEHYAIIDRELIWYGRMNLLGKSTSEDSMMRILSKQIAAELMEVTFGKEMK